jgi:acetyl esterase
MPHASNAGWMSMLLGRKVAPPPRDRVEDVVASRGFFSRTHLNTDLPDLAAVREDVLIRERGGTRLTAEVYVPFGDPPFPTVLYLHGGAWCAGSAKGARRMAMAIAAAGHTVVNLDYGLAPEHPFPHAVEDAIYAARWCALDAGGGPFAIAGESAGANLAAAAIAHLTGGAPDPVALDEGDLAGVPVTFDAALLIYGIFDLPLLLREPGSNVGSIEVAFNAAYLGPDFLVLQHSALVSPARTARLDGFPPTYLTCGDEDSLLGQTLGMAQALARAGVPTTLSVVQGADHTFVYLDEALPEAGRERERMLAWLASVLLPGPPTVDQPSRLEGLGVTTRGE